MAPAKRKAKQAKKSAARNVAQVTMLPEMRCFLACDHAGRTSSDGVPNGEKTSLQGLFDSIWISKLPGIYPQFYVFLQLVGGDVSHATMTIVACDPDGDQILEMTMESVNFTPDERKEVFARIPVLPLSKYGDIRFVAAIEGRALGWPLVLHVKKSE